MEDKKIIYIGSVDEKIKELVGLLEEKLKENEYIVYNDIEKENIEHIVEQSNLIKPNIHLCIHSYESINRKEKNGPIIYTLNKSSLSEEIANKIFTQLKLIYYEPTYNRDIVYTQNINELTNTKNPSLYIELYGNDNEEDYRWYKNNTNKIANSIFLGIDNYFKNRE